mgnify:CR=1 FL=1
MATEKTVNYTAEQTTKMVNDYVNNPTRDTVEKIATALGKTVKSVTAKLVREKVYIAKTHVRKDGTKVEKKDQTADAIGLILGLPENDIESLTKCTRNTLQVIFKALANSVPIKADTEADTEADTGADTGADTDE